MQMRISFGRGYFEARLDRNRKLAERSSNPDIRALHMEYVRLYRHLLEQQEALPA